MTLRLLVSGTLVGDPQRRTAANGNEYATALLRADCEGEPTIVSLIAFGDQAGALLACGRGDSVATSGKAKLTSWTGKDGVERTGISVTAEQIAALKLRPKSAIPRRVSRRLYPPPRPPRREPGPPLPADDVADLFTDAVP
jgi:hypothetical protein